jgi:hypothetical protein
MIKKSIEWLGHYTYGKGNKYLLKKIIKAKTKKKLNSALYELFCAVQGVEMHLEELKKFVGEKTER